MCGGSGGRIGRGGGREEGGADFTVPTTRPAALK